MMSCCNFKSGSLWFISGIIITSVFFMAPWFKGARKAIGIKYKNIKPSIIDNVFLNVEDFQDNLEFYKSTLGELGYKVTLEKEFEGQKMIGFGKCDQTSFFIKDISSGRNDESSNEDVLGAKISFKAKNAEQVDNWFNNAMNAGAESIYKPTHFPKWKKGIYCAAVKDPNGIIVKAIIHNYKE